MAPPQSTLSGRRETKRSSESPLTINPSSTYVDLACKRLRTDTQRILSNTGANLSIDHRTASIIQQQSSSADTMTSSFEVSAAVNFVKKPCEIISNHARDEVLVSVPVRRIFDDSKCPDVIKCAQDLTNGVTVHRSAILSDDARNSNCTFIKKLVDNDIFAGPSVETDGAVTRLIDVIATSRDIHRDVANKSASIGSAVNDVSMERREAILKSNVLTKNSTESNGIGAKYMILRNKANR